MIAPETAATEVQRLMVENNVRHIPVVGDGKRLLGMVTRQRLALKPELMGSLNVWEITRYLSTLNAKRVMIPAKEMPPVEETMTVERVARLINQGKHGGLPVIDGDGAVVGVVTETDLLQAFYTMLGLDADGVRVTVRMPNRPGEFKKLAALIGSQEWGVTGIGSFPTRNDPESYDVVLKILGESPANIKAVFAAIESQHIIDMREVS